MATYVGTEGNDYRDAFAIGEQDQQAMWFGAGGDDTLFGGNLGDYLYGNKGNDTLHGGEGRDVLYGDGSFEFPPADGGFDTLYGDGGDDLAFVVDRSGVYFDGGSGVDTISYYQVTAGLTINLATGVNGGDAEGDVLVGVENVIGSVAADILVGDGGDNLLNGSAGDDTLIGGAGADTLIGSLGTDLVSYADSAGAVFVDLGAGTGAGGDAEGDRLREVENVIGSAQGDQITGDSLDNALYGGDGADLLVGGAGADQLFGGIGVDAVSYATSAAGVTVSITTGAGSGGDAQGDTLDDIEKVTGSRFADRITGAQFKETLLGGSGNDSLSGLGGDDILSGGNGADRLIGAAGADRLVGGAGADRFVYGSILQSTVSATGRDIILDFSRAEGDRIDLSLMDANTDVAGDQAFRFIGEAAFTGAAGQLRFGDAPGGDSYLYADVNGDRSSDFVIRIADVASFAAGDFVL